MEACGAGFGFWGFGLRVAQPGCYAEPRIGKHARFSALDLLQHRYRPKQAGCPCKFASLGLARGLRPTMKETSAARLICKYPKMPQTD